VSDQHRTGYKTRSRRPATRAPYTVPETAPETASDSSASENGTQTNGSGTVTSSSPDAAISHAAKVEAETEAVAMETSLTEPPSTILTTIPTDAPPPTGETSGGAELLPLSPARSGDSADVVERDALDTTSENDAAMAAEEAAVIRTAPLLDRGLALPSSVVEPVLWALALGAALITRLASLTNTPLSTPEAQRAFAAWQWVGGNPGTVDGKLWGPFAFLQTGLAFFLFGAGDAVGRVGPALAGVALVAACLWLRPFVGVWGAWGAAILIALSPTFVYGSRQITGLPWVALAALVLFVCVLRAEQTRPTRGTVFLAVSALLVLLCSGAEGITMLLALALAVAITVAFAPRADEKTEGKTAKNAAKNAAENIGNDPDNTDDVGMAPAQRLLTHISALDRRVLTGALVLFAVAALALFSLLFTDLVDTPRTIGSVFGEWWGTLLTAKRNEPWFYYLMIAFIYEAFIGVAAIIALVVIARMKAPRPLAVSLAVIWQAMAVLLFSLSGGKSPEAAMMILLPLAVIGGIAFEWLATQLAGGWFWRERAWAVGVGAFVTVVAAVQFLRQIKVADRSTGWVATIFALVVLLCVVGYITATLAASQRPADTRTVLVASLVLLTGLIGVRAMSDVTFANPDDPHELLVGTRTAASLTPLVERIRRISVDLTRDPQYRTFDPQKGDRANITGGNALAVSADSSAVWPLQWYLRDFPNFIVQDAATAVKNRPNGPDGTPLPQLVVTQQALVGPQLPGYVPQNYAYTVSHPDSYRTETLGDILGGLVRWKEWGNRITYFLSRRTVQSPVTANLTVYYSDEVAKRIFYVGGGGAANSSSGVPTTVANLFDRAGKGKGAGQFMAPRGIAIGPDGTIAIVDQLNYRVQQFDANGAFLRQFGGAGTTPDKFGNLKGFAFGPTGITTAPDGTLFVADTWNHRVSVFSSTGQPLRQWGAFFNGQDDAASLPAHPSDFYGPRGIAVGPDGLVYVTDGGNGRLSVFKQDGTWVRTIGSRGTGPGQLLDCIGVAVKADGTIAVADPDNGRVQLFAANGTFLSSVPVMEWGATRGQEPYLVWLPNGNLLVPVPLGNKLYEITPAGQIVRTLTGNPGDLRRPVAIALLADGSGALVLNDETGTVVRFNLNG